MATSKAALTLRGIAIVGMLCMATLLSPPATSVAQASGKTAIFAYKVEVKPRSASTSQKWKPVSRHRKRKKAQAKAADIRRRDGSQLLVRVKRFKVR